MPNAVPCSLTQTAGGVDMYVPATGSQLAGVLSLNGEAGVVNVAGDAGVGVSTPGGNVVQLTTVGRPVNASTGTFSGAVGVASLTSGATVSATGAVSGASVSASGAVSGATVSATGAVSGASLLVGASGAQGNITYINTNIAYSGNTSYNVGIPVNYPALITMTASLAVGTGYVNAVFCSVNTGTAQWGLRQISVGNNGINYGTINPDTPAGTQVQVAVLGGGSGTIYTSYKIERSGV
jgi:hypothetical protein